MKRLLSILIAIALMATMSVTAFAAEEPTLYVAGVAVTSDNLEINSADNGAITGSATYDPDTKTLTLDNFSYTGEGKAIYASDCGAVIYSKGNLNLKLVGASSITYDNSASTVVAPTGVFVEEGNLTVTDDSDGSLTATADAFGIYAWGDLTISGGTIEVSGGLCGIASDEGNIAISGGRVEATSSYIGISANCNEDGDYGNIAISGESTSVTATADTFGIYAQGDLTITGTFDVYAGESAPGELVTSPTPSTYNSKYVKIEPAEPEAETQTTTITYQVDPTFTVTIPATVALGETATIKAENVIVAKGKQVEVTLTNANDFKVTTPQGASLTYTVKNGETKVNEGDTVLTVNPDGGKTGETTLTFTTPETVMFAGDYTGTVTFTIAVNPAVNN